MNSFRLLKSSLLSQGALCVVYMRKVKAVLKKEQSEEYGHTLGSRRHDHVYTVICIVNRRSGEASPRSVCRALARAYKALARTAKVFRACSSVVDRTTKSCKAPTSAVARNENSSLPRDVSKARRTAQALDPLAPNSSDDVPVVNPAPHAG